MSYNVDTSKSFAHQLHQHFIFSLSLSRVSFRSCSLLLLVMRASLTIVTQCHSTAKQICKNWKLWEMRTNERRRWRAAYETKSLFSLSIQFFFKCFTEGTFLLKRIYNFQCMRLVWLAGGWVCVYFVSYIFFLIFQLTHMEMKYALKTLNCIHCQNEMGKQWESARTSDCSSKWIAKRRR